MTIVPAVSKKPTPKNEISGRQPAAWKRLAADQPLLLLTLAIVSYGALFFATRVPSLSEATGQVWRRWRFFQLLLIPEALVGGWFGDPPQFAIADRLPILGAAATIELVAWLLGMLVLRITAGDRLLRGLERPLFAMGIGLSLISLYTLLAGLAGLLAYRLAFFVPGMLVIVTSVILVLRPPAERPAPRVDSGPSYARSIWVWLCVPFVFCIVWSGMLPPVEFDVREYHLQAPKEFYQAGRIKFLPHNVYANMALGSEMHSLLGMVLVGDWWRGALVGKTVQALFAPLTALALLAAGRRWFSVPVGALGAIIYLSTPWVLMISTTGLVEGVVAFYALATLYAFWLALEFPAHRRPLATMWLTGFVAGSAVATKYPAALFVLFPAAAAVAWVSRPHLLRPVCVFAVAAFIACGPWFAKNWVLTDNPTYPLLYEVFGGLTRTPEKDARWQRAHIPQEHTLQSFFRATADVTIRSEWLSPLIWPLAGCTWFWSRQRQLRWAWSYVAFFLLAWWFFTHRIDRFWIPVLSVLALLAGVTWTWAITAARRRVLIAFVGVGVLYGALALASPLVNDNAYFVSLDRLRRDPVRVAQWILWLNEHTPRGKRVLAVGDSQVFDLEMPVLYNTPFDDSEFEQIVCASDGTLRKSAEIAERLGDVAYIYVNWAEIARYRSPGNYGYSEFVQPAVFEELVDRGVLAAPIQKFADGAVQIFPVVGDGGRGRRAPRGVPPSPRQIMKNH